MRTLPLWVAGAGAGGGLSDDDGSGDDGRQALGIACQIDCSLASPPNGPVWMSQV